MQECLSSPFRVKVNGGTYSGNNASGGTNHGIQVDSGTSDFCIKGATLGGILGFGTQVYGCNISSGASDRYIVADNLVGGNAVGGVNDGGTGMNKRVSDNY